MKVSILVAVYNSANYLSECLESLLEQTHRDIQIICIDDASTDDSYSILQHYASKDERIVVLRMPVNSGQAKARNKGLEVADGDYVMMVDSDDWLAVDAIECACRVAQQHDCADAVLFDVVYHENSTGRQWPYEYRTEKETFSGNEAFQLSLDWSIHGLYMVRRDIHLMAPYDDTSRSYSDDNTTRLHYYYSREVWRSSGVYYYRQHEQSVTHKIDISRFDYLSANWQMRQQLLRLKADEKVVSSYETSRWFNLVGMYVFYWENRKFFTKNECKRIHKLICHYYQTIQRHLLPAKSVRKFGYSPCGGSFLLFKWQVCLYTFIRKAYYRIRGGRVE